MGRGLGWGLFVLRLMTWLLFPRTAPAHDKRHSTGRRLVGGVPPWRTVGECAATRRSITRCSSGGTVDILLVALYLVTEGSSSERHHAMAWWEVYHVWRPQSTPHS